MLLIFRQLQPGLALILVNKPYANHISQQLSVVCFAVENKSIKIANLWV